MCHGISPTPPGPRVQRQGGQLKKHASIAGTRQRAVLRDKAHFWQRWAGTPMNARQTLVLNRVLDGMEGKLTNAKWAAIGKCSAATALRDINDLLEHGVLRRREGGGRSTGTSCVSNRPLALLE